MMKPAALLTLILAALPACNESPKSDARPAKAAVHQLDLGGRIFKGIEKLPADADEDAARAVAEVVVPGYSPRLRMIVSGDNPVLAKGAAHALVRIRMIGEPDGGAALAQCAKSDTNSFVRDECARLLDPAGEPTRAAPKTDDVVSSLQLSDAEKRCAALRNWLDARPMSETADAHLLTALSEGLKDDDIRVRMLSAAALLRVTPADQR